MNELVLQLFIAVLLAGIFTVLLLGILQFYRTHREARYNEQKHRAELEMLRESFERRIYDLADRLMSTEKRWGEMNHLLISGLRTQANSSPKEGKVPASQFLASYGISKNELVVDPRLVFVLTPFNRRFQEPFDAIVKACQELGLRCLRGDEERVDGELLPHILRLLVRARVIVANIDGRNANVFYELGIAHALAKVTILVTKSIKSAPFDLRAKKLIVYQDMDDLRIGLQRELARSVVEIE